MFKEIISRFPPTLYGLKGISKELKLRDHFSDTTPNASERTGDPTLRDLVASNPLHSILEQHTMTSRPHAVLTATRR
jgi:hypothetical protein